MISDDDIKVMRWRAERWIRVPCHPDVTRDTAINEEHLALDVLDLLAERADLRNECDILRVRSQRHERERDALRAQLAKYEDLVRAATHWFRSDVEGEGHERDNRCNRGADDCRNCEARAARRELANATEAVMYTAAPDLAAKEQP